MRMSPSCVFSGKPGCYFLNKFAMFDLLEVYMHEYQGPVKIKPMVVISNTAGLVPMPLSQYK